jgi:Fe-S-cluster containining protein
MNIDDWFNDIRKRYASQMQCGEGCTACCYGLFDISLADAVEVARGFQGLPVEVQDQIRSKSAMLQQGIRDALGQSVRPTLFDEDDPRVDEIVNAANSPACPCLGPSGECLIYEHRPMACRLEGVPMVDVQDGLFGDWCELNFKEGIPDTALKDLAQDYDRIAASEEASSNVVARQAKLSDQHAVTFIPSVIAEYETFWKSLIR